MKIKLKFTIKNFFKIIFLALIIVNFILISFSVKFIKSQIYDTMFMSREELLKQSNLKVEDVDIDDFNEIIEKIKTKKEIGDIKVENNIFK